MRSRPARHLAALLPALLLAGAARADEPRADPVARGDWEGARRETGEAARAFMKRAKVAGLALAVVDGGTVAFADGYGWADAKAEVPAGPDTRFRAAGASAAVTVALALRLADQGRLGLDDPVTRHLPAFGLQPRFPGARPVTVRDLCTHRGGLPVTVAKGARGALVESFASVVEALRQEDPPRPPGEAYGWSEAGLSVLGAVLEAATGRPFADLARDELLVPAGMATAAYGADRDRSAGAARPHRDRRPAEDAAVRDVPALGLNASVRDLAAFLSMALQGGRAGGREVLRPATAAALWTRQNGDAPADLDTVAGLGWLGSSFLSLQFPGAGPAWHAGWGPQDDFAGLLVALPEAGLGVALLADSAEASQVLARVAEEALWAALQAKAGIPRPPEPPVPPGGPPPSGAALAAWEGDFATMFGHVRVRRKGDGLRADVLGRTFHLEPRRDGRLAIRYRVAGLVAVPMGRFDRVGLSLEDVGGREAMVAEGDGVRFVAGRRLPPAPVPEAWARRAGAWVVDNRGRDRLDVERPALRLEDGLLFVEFEAPRQAGDLRIRLPLVALSDDRAEIFGSGPGLGETIRAVTLPDGAEGLRWSGYLLRRK